MLVPMAKIIKGLGKTAINLMPNTPEEFIKLGFITAGLYSGDIECFYAAVSCTLLDQWFKVQETRQLETVEIDNISKEENTNTEIKAQTEFNHTAEANANLAQVAETETFAAPVIAKGVSGKENNANPGTETQTGVSYALPKPEANTNPAQAVKTETVATNYFVSPQAAYSAGVAMFKATGYDTAIDCLKEAIDLYQKEYSPLSKQVAICFSTLSSCYRELAKTEFNKEEQHKLRNEAIRFLDHAIAISLLNETMPEEEKSKLLDKKKTVLESAENSDKALSIYASAIRTLTGKEFQQPGMTEHTTKLISKAEKMSLSINYEKLTNEEIQELQLPETTINALLISKTNPEIRKQKAALFSTINDAGFAQLQNFFADPKNAEKAVELQRKFLKSK